MRLVRRMVPKDIREVDDYHDSKDTVGFFSLLHARNDIETHAVTINDYRHSIPS